MPAGCQYFLYSILWPSSSFMLRIILGCSLWVKAMCLQVFTVRERWRGGEGECKDRVIHTCTYVQTRAYSWRMTWFGGGDAGGIYLAHASWSAHSGDEYSVGGASSPTPRLKYYQMNTSYLTPTAKLCVAPDTPDTPGRMLNSDWSLGCWLIFQQ